uniref:Transmembrane protein 123 n=1 Tax=Apteryx owenii TaxID=8824 RepID=A0A8B9PMZ8_APTOW
KHLILHVFPVGQDSENADNSRSPDLCHEEPNNNVQGTNCSSSLTVASTTQSTATSIAGTLPTTTQLTNATQPTNSTTSAPSTTQSSKTSKTIVSTTVSSVTSSQLNITVTTSKFSSASVTAAPKSEVIVKTSRFDVGSFVGGIVLTLGILVILYIGCKTYHSRRGIQYRTIDEHDAII